MSAELSEVLEFLRDNVPTKSELKEALAPLVTKQELKDGLQELRTDMDSRFNEVDKRFDELEAKLDVREQLRLVERRVIKLEDARH